MAGPKELGEFEVELLDLEPHVVQHVVAHATQACHLWTSGGVWWCGRVWCGVDVDVSGVVVCGWLWT